MYESGSKMSCCTPNPSVENILKKFYLGGPIWGGFTSEYYNDNNDDFGLFFQQYTSSAVKKRFIHTLLLNVKLTWTSNIINRSKIRVFTYLIKRYS